MEKLQSPLHGYLAWSRLEQCKQQLKEKIPKAVKENNM